MGKARKNHSREFKAKVALEAARESQTLGELASRHKLHPTQIAQWKKQLLSNAPLLFEWCGAGGGLLGIALFFKGECVFAVVRCRGEKR